MVRVQSVAWELPYATGTALKIQQTGKKKKKNKDEKETHWEKMKKRHNFSDGTEALPAPPSQPFWVADSIGHLLWMWKLRLREVEPLVVSGLLGQERS